MYFIDAFQVMNKRLSDSRSLLGELMKAAEDPKWHDHYEFQKNVVTYEGRSSWLVETLKSRVEVLQNLKARAVTLKTLNINLEKQISEMDVIYQRCSNADDVTESQNDVIFLTEAVQVMVAMVTRIQALHRDLARDAMGGSLGILEESKQCLIRFDEMKVKVSNLRSVFEFVCSYTEKFSGELVKIEDVLERSKEWLEGVKIVTAFKDLQQHAHKLKVSFVPLIFNYTQTWTEGAKEILEFAEAGGNGKS